MTLEEKKNRIIYHMMNKLSTMKYGYTYFIEAAFIETQSYERLKVTEEELVEIKDECISRVTEAMELVARNY